MSTHQNLTRIGIIDLRSEGWAAGGSYTRMMVHSLLQACQGTEIETVLFTNQMESEGRQQFSIPIIQPKTIGYLPGEQALRKVLRRREKDRAIRGETTLRRFCRLNNPADINYQVQQAGIQIMLPVVANLQPLTAVKTIGWIPDFQHCHLPQFFSQRERQERDSGFKGLARRADAILVSSHSVLTDYSDFVPAYKYKACVLPFPSLLAFEQPKTSNPGQVVRKYNLPEKFALVANQFWAHKNHQIVLGAVKILKDRGVIIPLVLTGLPIDYRDPANRNLSDILQKIASTRLGGQVTLLGQVPYADLIDLMRVTAVVIQPSRFEGWSTIIQDAKALGRPLICSNLPVHKEQSPDALGFFDCDQAGELADILVENWNKLSRYPDVTGEQQALRKETVFAANYGRALLTLCAQTYMNSVGRN